MTPAQMKQVKEAARVLKKHFPNLTVEQTLDVVGEVLVAIQPYNNN